MSFISVIVGWFTKQSHSVKKVFDRIEPMVEKAEPLVTELSAVVKAVASTEKDAVMTAVAGWLGKATTDATMITNFVEENKGSTLNSLLHNAAVFALSFEVGPAASTVISDLDLAVQTAYSVVKEAAAAADKTTV